MTRLLLLVLFLLPIFGHTSIAQFVVPRQPDDNITGVFTESPLTWQFQQLSADSIFLRGYGVVWDTVQKAWGDTVALLEQSAEPYQGGIKFVETIRSKSPGGTWSPSRRTEVYNPAAWESNQKAKPDSVFYFTWDTGLANWVLQKKIVYAKDSAGYVTQRATFLSGHVIADTLEQFVVDEYWDHPWRIRLVFDAQNGSYKLIDSTLYGFVNDTFCPTTIIFDFQSGQKKPFRRYDFQFFNTLDTYELVTDYWSEEVDFWQSFLQETQAIVPNQLWISKQYITRTSTGPKKYKSTQKYYHSDWSPRHFYYEYFPSLEAFPDSVVRRDYVRDSLNGLISAIIERFQPRYEYVEFFNRFKWEFAWGTAPTVSADQPAAPPAKVQVSRLDRNIFLLDFGPEATGKKHLSLFDTSGKQLKTWSATGNTLQIDLSMCPAGVFYLHIADGRSSQTIPLAVY